MKPFKLKIVWLVCVVLMMDIFSYHNNHTDSTASTYYTVRRIHPLQFHPVTFYNRTGFEQALNMITDRARAKKPLLVVIDGDSHVGKTTLAKDLFFGLGHQHTSVIYLDSFYSEEELPPDYIAHIEQYGPIHGGIKNTIESWDYKAAGEQLLQQANSGQYDVIILEGLNAINVELANANALHFDVKIHVTADQQTREHIYKSSNPTDPPGMMNKFLDTYVTKYKQEMSYDLIIDNSLPPGIIEI